MSANRKKLLLNTVSVDLSCSCRRPRLLSTLFHPKPKYKKTTHPKHSQYHSSPNSWDKMVFSPDELTTTTTATTFSPNYAETPYCYSDTEYSSNIKSSRAVQGFGRIGGESLAVEKESDDPYLDFRRSMLQMILEKEIYSKDDLRELLNCFLQLNSSNYHGIIVRAFSEIWNGVFSVKNYGSPALHV